MQQSKTTDTSRDKAAGQRTLELYRDGFHCGESVLVAVLETMGYPNDTTVPRIATCFGGGIGRSHEEICGALAAALMAMGCVLGRDQPGANWDSAAQAAVALRERFLERHGSTCCGDILASLGPQQKHNLCHALSVETAELACAIIRERV